MKYKSNTEAVFKVLDFSGKNIQIMSVSFKSISGHMSRYSIKSEL
jgi:hypothetical protein